MHKDKHICANRKFDIYRTCSSYGGSSMVNLKKFLYLLWKVIGSGCGVISKRLLANLGDALIWFFILTFNGVFVCIKFPDIEFYYYGSLLILFSTYCFLAIICRTIYFFYKIQERKNEINRNSKNN